MPLRPLARVPLAVAGVALAFVLAPVLALAPVPSPVHVQPGAADLDGTVAWTPAVHHITGAPGDLIAVDLALDDGTEHDVDASLAVREVEVDSVAGPRVAGPSDALRLAADRIVLRPGERGALRGVAEIPAETTVVAVEAQLAGDGEARPTALIVLAPTGRDPELSVGVELAGGQAEVTVSNASAYPALVDLAVAAATWLGPRDDVQVGDVLVPARGERTVEVELSRGIGRRSVAVAAAGRGAPADATVRAATAAWPARSLLFAGVAALVLLLALTIGWVLRRS